MTNLFKKSALAVALLAAAGVAQAATVTDPTPVGFSKQADNSVSVQGANLVLDPSVDYPVGTKITIEFSAGELSVPGAVANNGGGATATFDLVSATTNKLVFEVKTATLTAAQGATLSGYKFTSTSLANVAGISATVSITAPTGALNFDPVDSTAGASLTRTVLIAGDQFAGAVTKNTYSINLATGRALLTGSTATAQKTVEFVTKLTNRNTFATATKESDTAGTVADVTGKKVKHTIAGDFSFVTDSNKDTIGIQAPKDAFTYSSGCAEVSLTASELVYECDTQAAADGYAADLTANAVSQVTRTVSLDLTKAGASATAPLMNGSYKATVVQNYGSSKTVSLLNNAEIVVLNDNGTTKHVDYMPFGENISQIVYVTNLVDEAGKVRLTVWDEKGTKVANNVEVTTTVTKNGIIPLAGELKKIVGDKATGKYRFSVSLESSSATVYAAYRVGADAAFVTVR